MTLMHVQHGFFVDASSTTQVYVTFRLPVPVFPPRNCGPPWIAGTGGNELVVPLDVSYDVFAGMKPCDRDSQSETGSHPVDESMYGHAGSHQTTRLSHMRLQDK